MPYSSVENLGLFAFVGIVSRYFLKARPINNLVVHCIDHLRVIHLGCHWAVNVFSHRTCSNTIKKKRSEFSLPQGQRHSADGLLRIAIRVAQRA